MIFELQGKEMVRWLQITVVLWWYSGSTNFPAVAGGKLKISLYGSQTILNLKKIWRWFYILSKTFNQAEYKSAELKKKN